MNFNLQRFADTVTSSFDLYMPLKVTYRGMGSLEGTSDNRTIKIPNPKSGLTLAQVTTLRGVLQEQNFLDIVSSGSGTSYSTQLDYTTTPYTEQKQTVTLDLVN